ncbi:MAG: hypothetical protein KJ604_20420, partial [Gammaproteobacteria bacterium]|nr:hypothetical protein [Gammaproteobacteria bacterium]
MILITVTINATAHRVSDELLTLEHSWLPYVFDFSAPQYRIAKQYGGWVRLGFGDIALSPDLFASDWPPPKNATATVQYTASTEAAAVTLFSCSMRLKTFGQTFVKYEMFEPVYPQNVLNEGPNYDGETVPYPRAFGVVSHVAPIRLVDDGSDQPCYHMGELSGVATGVGILALTYEDAGAATIVTTTSAHGYSNGNSVYISGTVNFDGYHVIRAASGSVF